MPLLPVPSPPPPTPPALTAPARAVAAGSPPWVQRCPAGAPEATAPVPRGSALGDAARRTARWAAAGPAEVRFAVAAAGVTHGSRADEATPANSLIKATALVADLRGPRARNRSRDATERTTDAAMIRRSDNAAASAVIRRLGVGPLRATAAAGGEPGFAPRLDFWGASPVTAGGQARLFRRIRSLTPPRHADYALGLLRTIVPEQRWGLWRSGRHGWRIAAKAGWDGRGHVAQAARLECRGTAIGVAVIVDDPAGHADAVRRVQATGTRILAPLGRGGCPPDRLRGAAGRGRDAMA